MTHVRWGPSTIAAINPHEGKRWKILNFAAASLIADCRSIQMEGNGTPSMVSSCYSPLRTLGKSGTAAIRPQINRAEAFLVTGGHRRHPASGLNWGPPFAKNERPLFSECAL